MIDCNPGFGYTGWYTCWYPLELFNGRLVPGGCTDKTFDFGKVTDVGKSAIDNGLFWLRSPQIHEDHINKN